MQYNGHSTISQKSPGFHAKAGRLKKRESERECFACESRPELNSLYCPNRKKSIEGACTGGTLGAGANITAGNPCHGYFGLPNGMIYSYGAKQ